MGQISHNSVVICKIKKNVRSGSDAFKANPLSVTGLKSNSNDKKNNPLSVTCF